MQQHTTLWQLDGWAKAVVHTACVHYDCCTRQHKVANKGARTAPCCDLDYQLCHIELCWDQPEHLSLMREHCLRCRTLPPFYHGKRSHMIVTQCVRVRACKNPQRGKEEMGFACLSCPTCMQRHQGVRSQQRGRRCRRRNGAVDNTLTMITQTHQTKRTKHALNAGHSVAASNAGIMRASPRLTIHVLYTSHDPVVWMGCTCKRS